MVARTLEAAREAGLDVTVWFTPGDAGPEMRFWLGDRWDLRPQASGNLGVRLAAAARAAEADRPWLALVGECPGIDAGLLREAAEIAERGDVVVGPTDDGGYYLIGGMPPLPDIFTAMPWGSDSLLGETRTRLAHMGIVWREVRPLTIVESVEHAKLERLLT
jgi:glycosyltransferase A (GT-A) superfamily protein (DUF2064 family)